MIAHLHRIRKERLNGDRGFTLTELLVVIVIIGILVAIAIPVFLSQREAAFARSAEADVRNAIPAIETYYAEKNAYPADFVVQGDGVTGGSPTAPNGLSVNVSPGVTLTYDSTGTSPSVYTVTASHEEIPTRSWTYNSQTSDFGEVTPTPTNN